ncbi:MAG: hypothetical protein ACE5KJ_07675, partial [Candidatus Zixiibacteriota bacterium]
MESKSVQTSIRVGISIMLVVICFADKNLPQAFWAWGRLKMISFFLFIDPCVINGTNPHPGIYSLLRPAFGGITPQHAYARPYGRTFIRIS